MAKSTGSYGEQSISTLKDEQQVRQRPSVIFGTNDSQGAAHGVYEIIANSIDEAREGYGKQIRVDMKNDGTVTVSDDGRGVPMGWNEVEKKWNWELVFCTLYASGKYDSSNYSTSLGLNGLGSTATQYASEFMDVISTYDGKSHVMHFKKGRPVGKMQVIDPVREGTGTDIRFKPDPEVFVGLKENPMPPDYYGNLLRRQAMLHPGLEILFTHEKIGKTISFLYKNGPSDFISEACEHLMLKNCVVSDSYEYGRDQASDPDDYRLNMRLTFNFTRESSMVELYHNGSHLYEGGVTMEALKAGITHAFEDVAHDLGKIGKNEHFTYKDIEGIFVCVGDTNAPGNRTFFKNQTKASITNPFIKQAFAKFVYTTVRNWTIQDKAGSDKVLTEVIANKTAREEAEKVSKKVVASLSKSTTGLGNKPKKFVDCKTKIPYQRELYIVEGDSALGACKLSRDAEFQALMPVRGKIMNCLKEDFSKILNSEIIVDLLRIFGCGVEIKSKYLENLPPFDITKLNYGKIIICTDADTDGMQIRCLVITMIYRLCPTLLKRGKVFIAETPLFEIETKSDTYFAYTEEEKVEIMTKLSNMGVKSNQIKINRSKGLGENDPEMMSVSTMHPNTRRLVPVEYPEDANEEDIAFCFNALLGDDIESRKDIIDKYFEITKSDVE